MAKQNFKKTKTLSEEDKDSCAWIKVRYPNGTEGYRVYDCTHDAVRAARSAKHWKYVEVVGMHQDVRAGR